MEVIPHHPLIVVTQDDMKKVRQLYDLADVSRIKESLEVIEEWCKKQDHLMEASKYLDRNVLERLFILARGSIESTKNRIDKYITSRGMMPELTLNRSIEEFENFWDHVNYIPLPKLSPTDQSRVMITKFLTKDLDSFDLVTYFRFCYLVAEYRFHYEYSISERYIIDLTNIHIGLVSKLNPMVLKKAEILCSEGFGTKIKGIHILNAPPYVDKLMFLLKQALREKVASRIHVHSSTSDLQKYISREILPKDYGGEEQSCEKLAAQWQDTLRTKDAKKVLENLEKLVSDESRRKSGKLNNEYMGIPGSFRRLNLD